MDSATKELLMQNADEFILDEEKIVTCRWLSKILEINIADSRDILTSWVEKRKAEHPETDLIVIYLVTGNKIEGGGALVTVVRESELQSILDTLEPGSSHHIYSVQKGKSFDNLTLLGVIEPAFKTSSDAIQCPESAIKVRLSKTVPVEPAVKSNVTAKPTPAPVVQKKNNIFVKQPEKKTLVEESNKAKKDDGKSENIQKVSPPADKKSDKSKAAAKPVTKGGIANFFSRPNGLTTQKVTVKTEPKENTPPQKEKQFFQPVDKTKDSKSDKENKEKSPPITNTTKSNDIQEVEIKKEIFEDVDEDIVHSTPQEIKVKKVKKNKKPAVKKRERENSSERKNVKRRKRIVALSESSDDDIFADSDSEKVDLKPKAIFRDSPSPPPKEASPPPLLKKRQKKYVDRTYTDEDGFIITSKEMIECSASEEDEPVQKKPVIEKQIEKKPVAVKKPVSTSNVKQSNLMSFFKKK